MTRKPIPEQWARVMYGRKRRAHKWRQSEDSLYYVRSACGLEILTEQLGSAIGLERCKHCDKTENHNG